MGTKVAMILYTFGLEYDDRIRKEITSITSKCPDVTFEIFAIVPKNESKEGITDYGVKFHIPYLKSRDKYASGSHTLIKAYDFYRNIRPQLKDFDAIWCADLETILFPTLLPKNKPLIWDLHELPSQVMSNKIMRSIFKQLTKRCSIMYHANQPRIDYLNELKILSSSTPQVAIRNYPNADIIKSNSLEYDLHKKFNVWRNSRNCIYLQGASSMIRRPIESASAIIESDGFCGVVVGGFPDEALAEIENKYGKKLINERLFFTDKIPQIYTKLFISDCIMGLVFYETCEMNNTYCEPNRMFQTVMMGKPVVVGCNPPMKDFIDNFSCGIALNSDGSSIEEIKSAILKVVSNYEYLSSKAVEARKSITWESQEDLLVTSFRKALNI